MLNIYNEINPEDLTKKVFENTKMLIRANLVHIYFDNNFNPKIEVISKADALTEDVLTHILNYTSTKPFLRNLHNDLLEINTENGIRKDNVQKTLTYLSMKNLFGIDKKNAPLISGNNSIGGTPAFNTANISLIYMASTNLDDKVNETINKKMSFFLKKITEMVGETNLLLKKEGGAFTFEYSVEDIKTFSTFVNMFNNNELNLEFDLNLEDINTKEPLLIFFDFPGLESIYDIAKGKEIINEYITTLKIGKPDKENCICKVCLQNKKSLYNMKAFFAPNPDKNIRNFNLIDKTQNQGGSICVECMNKIKDIDEILNESDNLYVDDISGEVFVTNSIFSISEIKNRVNKIGGTIYKYKKVDGNALYPTFVRNYYLKSDLTSNEILENETFLKKILQNRDILEIKDIDVKGIKNPEVKEMTMFIKNNFEIFKDFVLMNKKIPLYVFNELIRKHMTTKNLKEKGIFQVINFDKEFILEIDKNIGDLNMKSIILTTKEKINEFVKNDVPLELTDEEIVLLSGKLIRDLESLSEGKNKTLMSLKNVIKNNKGVMLKIQDLLNKYSHNLYDNKRTEIPAKILAGLSDCNIKGNKFELLFNIGYLTQEISIIYVKKGE